MRDVLVSLAAIVMVVQGTVIVVRGGFTLEAMSRQALLTGVAILMLWTVGR